MNGFTHLNNLISRVYWIVGEGYHGQDHIGICLSIWLRCVEQLGFRRNIFRELFLANRFPLVYLIYIFHRGLYRLAFNLQKVYSIKPFDFEK